MAHRRRVCAPSAAVGNRDGKRTPFPSPGTLSEWFSGLGGGGGSGSHYYPPPDGGFKAHRRRVCAPSAAVGNRKRAMHLDQVGFHVLSTPTPSEEGRGRQNVETDLVNIWTGVVREAISIRTL